MRGLLTDDGHPSQVQADFREGGEACSGVVPSTVTVFTSRAIGRTLSGVIEPGKAQRNPQLEFTQIWGREI